MEQNTNKLFDKKCIIAISTLKAESTDSELITQLKTLKETKAQLLETLAINESKDTNKPDESKLKEIEYKEKQMITNYKKIKKIHTEIINTLKEGMDNFKEKSVSI